MVLLPHKPSTVKHHNPEASLADKCNLVGAVIAVITKTATKLLLRGVVAKLHLPVGKCSPEDSLAKVSHLLKLELVAKPVRVN
jgi:hypothetical protein